MAVKLVPALGYCHGVQKALRLASEALEDSKCHPVYSLGSLIHNDQEVQRLEKLGLHVVSSLEGLNDGTLIIRAHGVPPEVFEEAERRGLEILDGTCTQVRRAQEAAKELLQAGKRVVVYGDRKHPETIGILGAVGGNAEVVENTQDARELSGPIRNIGILCQTTKSSEIFREICSILRERSEEKFVECRETACPMVWKRQGEAREIAADTDIMVVVGGRQSSNTRRLAESCEQSGAKTYSVETAEDLNPSWFPAGKSVGLTAGVSTPLWLVQQVESRLEELIASANQDCGL